MSPASVVLESTRVGSESCESGTGRLRIGFESTRTQPRLACSKKENSLKPGQFIYLFIRRILLTSVLVQLDAVVVEVLRGKQLLTSFRLDVQLPSYCLLLSPSSQSPLSVSVPIIARKNKHRLLTEIKTGSCKRHRRVGM